MDFVNLHKLHKICIQHQLKLVILITSRSPVANLASWTINRNSAGGLISMAKNQYLAAYRHLFRFLSVTDTPFILLSLEALLLDGEEYIKSLHSLLGLPQHKLKHKLKRNINAKHYQWFYNHNDNNLSNNTW